MCGAMRCKDGANGGREWFGCHRALEIGSLADQTSSSQSCWVVKQLLETVLHSRLICRVEEGGGSCAWVGFDGMGREDRDALQVQINRVVCNTSTRREFATI